MTLDELGLEFTRSEVRVDNLIQGHDSENLNRPPAPNRWSALQCIQHLVLTNELNTGALTRALGKRPNLPAANNDRIRPGLVWSFLLRLVDPKTQLRGFAPRVLRPATRLDPTETRRRFMETHDTLRGLIRECRGLDPNRIRFSHPAIHLWVSAGSAFWLLALHESRHLQQAERAVNGR
jgi:DinB superfamily